MWLYWGARLFLAGGAIRSLLTRPPGKRCGFTGLAFMRSRFVCRGRPRSFLNMPWRWIHSLLGPARIWLKRGWNWISQCAPRRNCSGRRNCGRAGSALLRMRFCWSRRLGLSCVAILLGRCGCMRARRLRLRNSRRPRSVSARQPRRFGLGMWLGPWRCIDPWGRRTREIVRRC